MITRLKAKHAHFFFYFVLVSILYRLSPHTAAGAGLTPAGFKWTLSALVTDPNTWESGLCSPHLSVALIT